MLQNIPRETCVIISGAMHPGGRVLAVYTGYNIVLPGQPAWGHDGGHCIAISLSIHPPTVAFNYKCPHFFWVLLAICFLWLLVTRSNNSQLLFFEIFFFRNWLSGAFCFFLVIFFNKQKSFVTIKLTSQKGLYIKSVIFPQFQLLKCFQYFIVLIIACDFLFRC